MFHMGHRILKPIDYAKRGGFIIVASAISSGAKSVQPDLPGIPNYVDIMSMFPMRTRKVALCYSGSKRV